MPILGHFPGGVIVDDTPNYGLKLASVTGVSAVGSTGKVALNWTDPSDLVYEDEVVAEWGGTLVVYKAGSAPTSVTDGTTLTVTTRNQYASSVCTISSLSTGSVYYFAIYAFTTEGVYSDPVIVNATPTTYYLGAVTNISASQNYTSASLKWNDPDDVVVDGVTVARWSHTIVRYSTSSYPTSPTSGSAVGTFYTRDQYATNAYTWSGLNASTTYYVAFFPVSTDGNATTSTSQRVTFRTGALTYISSVPSQYNTLTYNGNAQSPTWSNYNTARLDISGTYEKQIDADTYTAYFTPKPGYCWSDGSTGDKAVSWVINRAKISRYPSTSTPTLTYTDEYQSPTWNYYDSSTMTMSGTTSAWRPGSYTTYFTPDYNYMWSNGSTSSYSVSWKITNQVVSIPTQQSTLYYTGSEQTPSWNNYDSSIMSCTCTPQTNVGSYTATFSLTSSYCEWSDGSTGTKTASWSISKGTNTIGVSTTEITLNENTTTATFSVVTKYPTTVTATSNNSAITVTRLSGSGDTYTFQVETNGTYAKATITVTGASSTNFYAGTSRSVSVTAQFMPENLGLEDMSWNDISVVSQAGEGPNYWAIGDTKTDTITGSFGSLNFYNVEVKYLIIGFNHNANLEGDNTTHFMFYSIPNMIDAHSYMRDDGYGDYYHDNETYARFIMNTQVFNTGGWEQSYMRNTICTEYYAAMSSSLHDVVRPIRKYSNNTGSSALDNYGHITATTDYVFICSEYEILGSILYSNRYESSFQEQYEYYRNGGSVTIHSVCPATGAIYDLSNIGRYWTRSPLNYLEDNIQGDNGETLYDVDMGYVTIKTNAQVPSYDEKDSDQSRGFLPCFAV